MKLFLGKVVLHIFLNSFKNHLGFIQSFFHLMPYFLKESITGVRGGGGRQLCFKSNSLAIFLRK